MYDELRKYLADNNMTTHTFYLDEFVENEVDDAQDPPNVFKVWDHINTQARLDLHFQRYYFTALDYCMPNDDGNWACMTVSTQLEYIVAVDEIRIVSVSDGMGK